MSYFIIILKSVFVCQEVGILIRKLSDTETGKALSGVNIIIQGTSIGFTTDLEGDYYFTIKPVDYTIIVNYLGYKTQ